MESPPLPPVESERFGKTIDRPKVSFPYSYPPIPGILILPSQRAGVFHGISEYSFFVPSSYVGVEHPASTVAIRIKARALLNIAEIYALSPTVWKCFFQCLKQSFTERGKGRQKVQDRMPFWRD